MYSHIRPINIISLVMVLILISCRDGSDAGSSKGVIWNSDDWTVTADQVTADKAIILCTPTDSTINQGYISQTYSIDHFFNNGISWSLTLSDTWNYPIADITAVAPLIAFTDPEQAVALIRSTAERCLVTGNYWPLTGSNVGWIDAARLVTLATCDPDLPKLILSTGRILLQQDFEVAFDPAIGLFAGLLDSDPPRSDSEGNPVVYSLRTNVVHARAYTAMAEIAEMCGQHEESRRYNIIASSLVSAINDRLWISEQGRYGSSLMGKFYPVRVDDYDNYGQALAIIYGVATKEMASSIIASTPMLSEGIPSRFPTVSEAVFPAELQSLWAVAGRKAGNRNAILFGLASSIAQTYSKLPHSASAANCAPALNSVIGILFGLSLTENGLTVQPAIPSVMPGTHQLKGIEYRDMTLDITVNGTGNRIVRFEIDNEQSASNSIPADFTGHHNIVVTMANNEITDIPLNFTDKNEYLALNYFSRSDRDITFKNSQDGITKALYENGIITETTSGRRFTFEKPDHFNVITATLFNNNGISSLPIPEILSIPENDSLLISHTAIPYEPRKRPERRRHNRRKARRQPEHLEMNRSLNTSLKTAVNISNPGEYFIDLAYWRPIVNETLLTDLYVNGERTATFIMSDRSGFTNSPVIRLNAGKNEVQLIHRPLPALTDDGGACLEYIRLIRKP